MDEKKLVTWEMFKKYHENLMGHIEEQDDLALEDLELYSDYESEDCEEE